jgi:hypothetical protein
VEEDEVKERPVADAGTEKSGGGSSRNSSSGDDSKQPQQPQQQQQQKVLFGNLGVDTREDPIYDEVKVPFAEYLEATRAGAACPYYAARIVFDEDLPELCPDVPPDARYRECFGDRLFAGVIGYIGAGGNRTPTHVDMYENCLHVVRGSKDIILYHPSSVDLMRPRTYGYNYSSIPGGTPRDSDKFRFWNYVKGLRVTVNEGEMLYLPYGWWHDVTGGDGLNIIVNHWYEMRPEKRRGRDAPVEFET